MIGALAVRVAATDIAFPLEVRWSSTLPAPPAFAPAFDDEHAYVPLKTTSLVAVRLKDGGTAWSVDCPMTARPSAGDSLVFAGSDGLIEARASGDGRARWRRPVKGMVVSLHWDTGWLIASIDAGRLLALRATDGVVLWEKDLGSPLHSPPAPAGDRVYLPLSDGRLVALSLTTGADVWTTKFSEPVVGILAVGDRVFVASRDNQLHAVSADDADADWRWPTGADLVGAPVLDERRVYFVGLDNVLRGNNRNSGTLEWRRVLPLRPIDGPILNGQTLIVAGVASELRAYSTVDGSPAGEMIVKGSENEEILLAAPPHLTQQGLVILVTRGGQIRALGTGAAPAPAPPAPADAARTAAPAP
jgi:outer membrane protein assembly factor BamB